MEQLKIYSEDEALKIIDADPSLKADYEDALDAGEDLDLASDYCNLFMDENNKYCLQWMQDEEDIDVFDVDFEEDFEIEVDTLAQAIVAMRDIDNAEGNIKV